MRLTQIGSMTAQPRMRSLLARASWLLPASVFAIAGAGKLTDPPQQPPALLAGLAAEHYLVLMSMLGFAECLLAILLCVPKTRRLAVTVAAVLLAAFSVFAALSSQDPSFAASCGCFGALSSFVGGGGTEAVIVRNGVVGGLLVAAFFGKSPNDFRPAIAVATATIWMLAGLHASEVLARRHAERVTVGLANLQRRGDSWSMPELDLRSRSGHAVGVASTLREGDVLVAFTPQCPHCGELARHLPGLSSRLARRQQPRRIVLIALSGGEELEAFLGRHRLLDFETFVLADTDSQLQLGITQVPTFLEVERGHRIAPCENQHQPPTLRVPASSLADVSGTEAMIVSGRSPAAHNTTLIVHRDDAGVLVDVRMIAAGSYVRLVDPDGHIASRLIGLPTATAIAMANRLAKDPTLEAAVWRSVGASLSAMTLQQGPPAVARRTVR